jgi:hypothetical protein
MAVCEPTTILTVASLATAAIGQVGAYQSGKAQVRAINKQNEIQAQEIAESAGVEMTESARAARRERGALRAAGAESGINLGSNSFLASLQTSVMNQYNDQGLILRNESNQQRARTASARSAASQIQIPNALSAALSIGAAGVGAYYSGQAATRAGQQSVTG